MSTLEHKLGDDGDAFYSALMEAHEGLTENESHRLNARLVLILANEVADVPRLLSLLTVAKGSPDDA